VPTSSNTTWDAVVVVAGSTGYRLPTEAQWEYASDTTKGTASDPWVLFDVWGWIGSISPTNTTHEVGKKMANLKGLYDTLGNVFEWCWDWYDANYGGVADVPDMTDPVGASSGTYRSIRGGGIESKNVDVRSAWRGRNYPYSTDSYVGFRVLRP
jgi:formylglycine-generating enzyme required for sulfatase activity